ncbi:hypothetical protein B0H14DRAFT_3862859 [Mycena olivaceomarginata]|nr:hypothetical protein B0H14DRAFT_3862859 [Mycena olivaceomarginata]
MAGRMFPPSSSCSCGPSPRCPTLSGSAPFDPSGAVDPDDTHPVPQQSRIAVVTAVSGIGAAAAHAGFESDVLVVPTDVTFLADVEKLRETVYEA